MARLVQIVIDSDHPASLARFWAAALDGFSVRAYDTNEIARLASLGFTPETDPTVLVDGPGLELCFQCTGDVRSDGKSRLHLDIVAEHLRRAEEVRRLLVLGAVIVEQFDGHTWMTDPEGNDFCVTGV